MRHKNDIIFARYGKNFNELTLIECDGFKFN